MKFLVLLLGVLFILTLFNVGESFLKRLNVKKIYALIFIGLEIISLFLPSFKMFDINFTISGFVLPAIISLFFLREIKNKKYLGRIFIAFLSVVLITQLFLLTKDLYLQSEIVGWLVVSVMVGIISLFICYYPKQAFISLFWGVNIAEIIFYSTRNFSDFSGLLLGNNTVFFAIISSFLIMLFCYNIYYVIRRRQKRKAFHIV